MRVSYHPAYVVPLPERHPFPMGKFSALRDLLVAEGVIDPADIVEPREADWADLLLVHTRRYLDALAAGTLTRAEERRMGLPWSEALVRRSRLAVQGTVNAMSMALVDGVAGNLAGGTHHAMPDWPEGFCVLNDVAVALRVLQQFDARLLEQRQRVLEDAPLGQGDGQRCGSHVQVFTLLSARHATNGRAQGLQFFLDALVTTVDVIDTVNNCISLRH